MSNKPLFSTTELNSPKQRAALYAAFVSKESPNSQNYSGKASEFVKELDHLLTIEAKHIDFMTAGKLSLHHIIEIIIQKFGPCQELYLSTWAIKEAAARSLFNLVRDKKIGSLHGIFDYRVKTVDSLSFNFIQPFFHRYELTKNHSKVVLIEYADKYITILCSANMSNNPRIEAGFISTCHKTFHFHKGWMLKVFDGKKVY